MVEPLTMALFAAAELVLGKLGGKALDAILEPTDELLKTQVKALTGRGLSKVRQNAFQEALKKARDDFLAGVSETEAELAWEPVAEGLSIARYPVTNAQYRFFVEEGGYQERRYWTDEGWRVKERGGWTEPRYAGGAFDLSNHPVVSVSWYEAVAYCRWLMEKLRALGGLSEDEVVRLPTEREWQQAAQGDDGRAYPWGEWAEGYANTIESGIGQTSAVGLFPEGASPCGALDMAGNVWEWCADWYGEYRDTKVLRGGSWLLNRRLADCTFRYWGYPRNWYNLVGFRCARGSQ
jgi:formylglycine-generating enzyme required for sulfatase activity